MGSATINAITNEIKNQKLNLASKWKRAQDTAGGRAVVKQTITGPHMLSRFSSSKTIGASLIKVDKLYPLAKLEEYMNGLKLDPD